MCHDNSGRRDRRGVLLLLVLSILTLFLLMGATLLTIATRARTAARAFSSANDDFEASPALPRALLDEALLILIRGSKDEKVRGKVSENLLGDMYEVDGNRVPFRDEPFDAYGDDVFLTRIDDAGGVETAAFAGDRPTEVDNDADGEPDGVWLDDVLPAMTSSRGGRLTFRVSYLVRDLDARINVNAHGGTQDPLGPAAIDASQLTPFKDGDGWTLVREGGNRTDGGGAGRRKRPVIGRRIAGRTSPAVGGSPPPSPYVLRLDREAPRPADLAMQTAQNPFTPGELERVLRPVDPDCASLPPRLAALLNDLDGTATKQVTTDSWDTTNRKDRVGSNSANPVRRFNLNRPLENDDDKRSYFQELYGIVTAAGAPDSQKTRQWVANIVEFRDRDTTPTTFTVGGAGGSVTGAEPDNEKLRWNVGDLVSIADLIGVPVDSGDDIRQKLINDQPLFSLLRDNDEHARAILEAVEVPSRFEETLKQDPGREPGRVNVNTCDSQIWQLVAEGGPPGRPGRPYKSMWDLLKKVAGGDGDVLAYNRDLANRLGAVATVRSNVFAVWITLEVTDSSPMADSPTCHRLFAIVDRSIPADYYEGENRNVRQTIRLKRFLN
jgi:hypothetical protein